MKKEPLFGLLNSNFHNSLFFGGQAKLRQISFKEMRTYFSFGLTLRDIPNSITPHNHPPPATNSIRTARTPLYPPVQVVPPYSLPLLFFSCPGQRNRWRPVNVPVTDVCYNSLFWMCTLNTLTWPYLIWRKTGHWIYLHLLQDSHCYLQNSPVAKYLIKEIAKYFQFTLDF